MMNYIAKFGLEYNPFLKEKSKQIIELSDYKQLMIRFKYIEESHGIGLITGDPGLGKTTAVRNWAMNLNKSLFKVIYIQASTLSVTEFYRILAEKFGIEPSFSKRKNFLSIQKEITSLSIERRITPVIIIDEANHLPSALFNELKILLNFDMDSRDRVILLLVGQNVIRSMLNYKSNEAFKQRISLNYSFEPIPKDEAKLYIETKLKNAGLNSEILSPDAFEQIINYASGSIRVIDQVMTKAFIFLCNKKENIISGDMMLEAINEYSI